MALVAQGAGYAYAADTRFRVDALREVDFEVVPGELVVVAGTTGSGKSTLLRLLAGLLEPTEGLVSVDGIAPTLRAARGSVALVFQNPETQFFAETVLADVAFGPRNLGSADPHAAAREALTAVGLDPDVFGPRSPFTLSGGEARRVAIAGALAMKAGYLLLDEPTAGLDARGCRDVVDAVVAERDRAGVVVVTHDPEDFLCHADRVVALSAGSVVISVPPSELTHRHAQYESSGLRLPEVVRAQILARQRGAALTGVEFDPRAVGVLLAESLGAPR